MIADNSMGDLGVNVVVDLWNTTYFLSNDEVEDHRIVDDDAAVEVVDRGEKDVLEEVDESDDIHIVVVDVRKEGMMRVDALDCNENIHLLLLYVFLLDFLTLLI